MRTISGLPEAKWGWKVNQPNLNDEPRTGKNLRRQVYDGVVDDIVSLRVKPGDVYNEKTLAERFHVSKSPVREALLELSAAGIVRSIPRYGYEVLSFSERYVRELLRYRRVVECGYMRLHGDKLKPEQLCQLETINAHCADAQNDIHVHWQYNKAFHLYLMDAYGEPYAYQALQDVMEKLTISYAQAYYADEEGFILDTRNHALILDHLRVGDVEKAACALSEDLSDFGGLSRFC